MASPGFHLQHLSGVLDRLFTYARNQQLSAEQVQQLHDESLSPNANFDLRKLLQRFHKQVEEALLQLRQIDQTSLTEQRFIGRKKVPTTVMGLLFHAAEHTMRHIGQLMVTVKVLKATPTEGSEYG